MSAQPASPATRIRVATVTLVLVATTLFVPSAAAKPELIPIIPPGSAYRQMNLVSDTAGMALVQDSLLVSPWGMAMTASGPIRIANDGTSTSTSYRGDTAGDPITPRSEILVVPGGLPTGIVANPSTSDFVVSSGSGSAPASILFASITGNISGWNSLVPSPGSKTAVIEVSNPGHVYTGIATSGLASGNRLYAADFANDHIDAFTSTFSATTTSGDFADPTIPAAYNVYNIQRIGASLYVTYALVGPDGLDVEGVGNGFVRRFNTDGVRDLTFGINNGPLNSPWGIVIAPPTFGIFGGALLIGNSGAGNPSIHAFNPTTGAFLGTIQDESGHGIVIDDLRGLAFGNGFEGGSKNRLYFTAGVGAQQHGLLGSFLPTTSSASSLVQFGDTEYSISEGLASIQVTVTRNGNASNVATVRYATWDLSAAGQASQKSDYSINTGVLRFAAGETSQTFTIRLTNDRFVEGPERIQLMLSNPTGTGVGLGSPHDAQLEIVDNDVAPTSANPIDGSSFFIRQHYLDFLGREPSAVALNHWWNMIEACGTAACKTAARNTVSSQILLSAESVDSVGLIYRMHKAAYGNRALYGELMLHAQVQRARGVTAMTEVFMANPEFVLKFGDLSNSAYVNTLVAGSAYAFSTTTKNAWISGLNGATLSRATVLLQLARHSGYQAATRSGWTVLAGYWGYFRRDPDVAGFNARLNLLNAGGGNPLSSGLINGFVTSPEYRQRFGPS